MAPGTSSATLTSMPPFPSEGAEERITAWRLAMISIALTVMGELVFLALDLRFIASRLVPLLRGLHCVLGLLLLARLYRRR